MYPTLQQSGGYSTAMPSPGTGYQPFYPAIGQMSSPVRPPPGQVPAHQSGASSQPYSNGPAAPPTPSGTSPPQPSHFSSLRVNIAEPYRLPPRVTLGSSVESIPRTDTSFDFSLAHKVMDEAAAQPDGASLQVALDDPWSPAIDQCVQQGYARQEVAMALAALQDASNTTEVLEFCKNYRELQSMGFKPDVVVGALVHHKNKLAAATDACIQAIDS